MIPGAKHLNFYDESIGSIHTIKFSGIELHRLIQEHPHRRIETSGEPVGWKAPDYPAKGKEIDCWDDWYDGEEWDEEYNSEL